MFAGRPVRTRPIPSQHEYNLSCAWIMVFQRDLVRAAEHFLRVARYVLPSPIGDPCELPRSPFLASFLSADDTAGDTDSGSSASPAQEQTRLEQRTSAKLPGVSQSSKRPARWSMLRASSISGACAVRTKEMSRILSIPAAVLTDERS